MKGLFKSRTASFKSTYKMDNWDSSNYGKISIFPSTNIRNKHSSILKAMQLTPDQIRTMNTIIHTLIEINIINLKIKEHCQAVILDRTQFQLEVTLTTNRQEAKFQLEVTCLEVILEELDQTTNQLEDKNEQMAEEKKDQIKN